MHCSVVNRPNCAAQPAVYAHVDILADHVTLSVGLPEKLVSCLAALLAKAPKRRRLQ